MSQDLNPTGKKILFKAQQMLQERGFQFFSFQDLADSVGIRKASVHHYFATKEDLALRMITDYKARIEKWFAELDAKEKSPKQKLNAYFHLFQEISCSGKQVCPGGSLLLDWNNFSKNVHTEIQSLMGAHRRWLSALLEESVKRKTSRISSEQIPAHVILLASSIQGGMQVARASKDSENTLKHLFKQLEAITFTERAT